MTIDTHLKIAVNFNKNLFSTYGSFRRSLSFGRPKYSANSWNRILIKTRLQIWNKENEVSGELFCTEIDTLQ